MDEAELKAKFPNLKPMSGSPTLFLLNGCGLTVYFKRDYDKDTQTYIKTYCLCFIFIPVIPICGYRVADAGGDRWYFLGREPLSTFAKTWNLLLLSSVLVLTGFSVWKARVESPEYVARGRLADARSLTGAGQTMPAARKFAEVIRGKTVHATAASAEFKKLLQERLAALSASDAVEMLNLASSLETAAAGCAELFAAALQEIKARQEKDPEGALALLNAATALAPADTQIPELRESLLEQALAKSPGNASRASELALIYEGRKQFDKCETLLAPLAKTLGTSEGARILGEIHARADRHDEAYALLSPYTEGRLKQLHAAEQAYQAAVKRSWEGELARLRAGRAGPAFYKALDQLPEAARDEKIGAHLQAHIRNDATVKAKMDALTRESSIVPVALDLGIVRLQRARNMSNPAERKKELEAAEKLFLAIQGVAGETDEYRLFFGQVCYWLDKQEEGKKQFDDLLSGKKRAPEMLLAVANNLREVGANSEARALAEEAYNKETDAHKKSSAAGMRAVMPIDLNDKIKWLRLCDSKQSSVAASLNEALGQKAAEEGKDDAAAGYLRKALAGYEAMPKNSTTLNNGALAAFSLFHVTRDRADFQKGLEMIGESSRLASSNSITLANYSHYLLADAMMATIGDAIDLKTLDMSASQELLRFLYTDEPSRDKIVAQLRQQPSFAQAMTCIERLRVLAPKSADECATELRIYRFTRDLEGMRGLQKRLKGAQLDLAGNIQLSLDVFAGKKDAELLESVNARIRKLEKLLASNPTDKSVLAVANHELAETLMNADVYGQKADANRVVGLAEKAHSAESSSATNWMLINALLFRAGKTMAAQEPALARMEQGARRSLALNYVVAYAAMQTGKLRDTIARNPDARRAVELMRSYWTSFPSSRAEVEWPLFAAVDPEGAKKVAETLQKDELSRIERELEQMLSPVSASAALQAYFAAAAEGNEPAGRKILQEFAKRGTPLPEKP